MSLEGARWAFALACLAASCGEPAVGESILFSTWTELVGDTVVFHARGALPDSLRGEFELIWRASDVNTADSAIVGDAGVMNVGNHGEVYLWDPATPAIWLFDKNGGLRTRIGRKGSGPGEYLAVNGIASLPDDRMIAWDGGNGRMSVYSPAGRFIEHWQTPVVPQRSNLGIFVDSLGTTWMRCLLRSPGDQLDQSIRIGWVRIDSSGRTMDTVFAPTLPEADTVLRAEKHRDSVGLSRVIMRPYGRYQVETVSRSGSPVVAQTTPYRVYWDLSKKHHRVDILERPIELSANEKRETRRWVEQWMREADPQWAWRGVKLPDERPPIVQLLGALDGRIWVQRSSDRPRAAVRTADARLQPWLTSAEQVWDVFEPTGELVGRASTNLNFRPYAARGDSLWGILRDDNDVPTLAKMAIRRRR